MKKTDKEITMALYNIRAALYAVVANQEYQKRSGGKYFTSAPTEMEWKRDNQVETDRKVNEAIALIDDILFG